MSNGHLSGFDLVAHIGEHTATATMRHGALACSTPWRRAAQGLVDAGVWFERDGRRFRASLEGDPMSVFMTLVRCPVTIVSASLDMPQSTTSLLERAG
jgi:hypothetical protein